MTRLGNCRTLPGLPWAFFMVQLNWNVMSLRLLFAVAVYASFAISRADDAGAQTLRFYLPPSDAAVTAWRGNVIAAQLDQRKKQADQSFAEGKKAAEASDCSTAARLAYETLYHNPDHEAARKLLGYQRVNGGWGTDYQAAKLRGGSVWHAKFGWLKTEQVTRYENGERYLNGLWVRESADAAFRKTIDQGWRVDTEHFRLTTNVSLEEGVRLAERLEFLYYVWRQVFARYHTPATEWKRLFAGGEPRKLPPTLYHVMYLKSKDEYVALLKKRIPQIEITSGIFMNDDDRAYFYADATTNNDAFLFHEVVHQLFALTKNVPPQVGTKGNFWVIEGVACYFESLKFAGDEYAELGDPANPRIVAAHHRRLVDDFYVPLAELTTFSMQRLQRDERIKMLYSQSSGLAWFLLESEKGRYREALNDYLTDVYTAKDTPTSLSQRTGRSFDELDAAYLAYLKSLPPR